MLRKCYFVLGVTIDSQLNFDKHISEICKKGSQQLNILKRMGKYLNRLGRLTVYYSFILSNFNYTPVTWLQERTLRFIYEDYANTCTYENLLKKIKFAIFETFKIIHKQSPSNIHKLIVIKDQNNNFRHQDSTIYNY